MKIVLAIDSFKGCLSSFEAEMAAKEIFARLCPTAAIHCVPLSDGGDGMLEAYCRNFDCDVIVAACHDALMRPIKGCYAIRKSDGLCILETASACGINLLKKEELNPLIATTYGVGELLIDAVRRGCKSFLIGLGGSATSDCGLGMLKCFREMYGELWYKVPSFSLDITLASDVENPLCGVSGAAHVFAPQKGANPDDVECLERRAQTFSQMALRKLGRDCSLQKGAGAAGGLGYAFMQFFHAKMQSGATLLLEEINFANLIAGADFILTGEGCSDRQTLMGKLPQKVLEYGQKEHISVHLIAGRIVHKEELIAAGFQTVRSVNPPDFPLELALEKETAKKHIQQACAAVFSHHTGTNFSV